MWFARNSSIPGVVVSAEKCLSWDCGTSRDSRHVEQKCSLMLPACGSGPFASSESQFSYPPNARNLSTRQVPIQIPKVILEFRQSFALGHVVGEFLEVAEPHALILPVDVTGALHETYSTLEEPGEEDLF
jgi:hypothetical protein